MKLRIRYKVPPQEVWLVVVWVVVMIVTGKFWFPLVITGERVR